MQKKFRLSIAVIIIVVIIVVGYLLLSGHTQKGTVKLPSVPVKLVKAQLMKLPITGTAMGQLVTQNDIVLTAQQSGIVTQIFVKDGEVVKKGQTLLTIQDQSEVAATASAQSALANAKLQYDRYQTLLKEGAIAKETFDQAKASYLQAKASVDSANQDQSETTLVAPFNGRIGIIPVAVGSNVEVGDNLMPLSSHSDIVVQYALPEHDYGQAKIGQRVDVNVSAYPEQTFIGKVSYIAPTVSTTTRAFNVRAAITDAKGLLAPGMLATVTQIFNSSHEALVIPAVALVPAIDGMTVYRIKNHKVYSVPVTVGSQYNDKAVITEGLKEGEDLIASGNAKVNLGTQVKVAS